MAKKPPKAIKLSAESLTQMARQAAEDDDRFHNFGVERLKVRLTSDHERLIVTLKNSLFNLKIRTEQTIQALGDGKALDVHLVVNAAGITEEIARWNMVRDLIPYLYEELEKK